MIIAECAAHSFVMESAADTAHIAEKYGKTYSFVGNDDCLDEYEKQSKR
jgi:hypothetical protein